MKCTIAFLAILFFSSSTPSPESQVEFVCARTHKSSNVCYYNFVIDGVKYSYADAGCREMKKKDQLIEKVKSGKIALVRDWKIDCPGTPQ